MGTQVTVYDGAQCIGGSKIYLQADDTGLFLDFGMNFGAYGKYFEEFVQPRTVRGIHDLWALGLIPHIEGIYRADLFPADFKESGTKRVQVDGVFLSHAHLDHTGNVGLLDLRIPIYASTMTAAIVKAMQDCGRPSFESEVAYTSLRDSAKLDGRALKSTTGMPCPSRPVKIVDSATHIVKLSDFWSNTFSSKKIQDISLSFAQSKVGNVEYKAFAVDHSIFGATAYAFETSSGWIGYSGDLRLHGTRGNLTKDFVEQLALLKPRALLIEGTNISEDIGSSEEEVYRNCLEAAKAARGRLIVADFGPRNVERLQIFLRIAHETQRKLVITAKDAFLLYAMHLVDSTVPDVLSDTNLEIFDEIKAAMNKWEKEFIRTDYADKFVSASEISKNQENYIVAFSFFDLKHLLDVAPKGGIYIYSTCEAFSEEMEIDVRRLKNWLDFFGMEPVGFAIEENDELVFFKGYHASGHISGEELVEVIKTIKPQILIPIHTEKPELFSEKLAGEPIQVVLPRKGIPIAL